MHFRTIRPLLCASIPALVALTLVSATKSGAQVVIFDNLTQAVAGVDVSGYNAAAQEFVTGGTALQLTSVTVPLEGPTSDTLGLALYSDNGSNSPGGSLVSLGTAVPTSTTSFTDITVTPASSITLAANTSYWLVGYYAFSVTPQTPGPWAYTSSSSSSGVGSLGANVATSIDGGSTWNTSNSVSYGPYELEVQGSSNVPEPGVYALLGSLGLTCAAFLRRRRAR